MSYHDRGPSGGGRRWGSGGQGRYHQGRGERRGGGRGYDSRGWRNQGGGRGGGRSSRPGRGRGPDLSDLSRVITNDIPVEIGKNFSFYLYSVECRDDQGNMVEQRWVRQNLFNAGLDTLLADLDANERKSLKRVVFFQGAFCFAGRPIPGLEPENLPRELQSGENATGNTVKCVGVQHFGAPTELVSDSGEVPDETEAMMDTFRCSECNRSFALEHHMIQHCTQTGHEPVYAPTSVDGSASTVVFLQYLNVVLQRALSERMRRWGEAYIDPDPAKAIPAKDRQGRYLGVDIYEAYFATFSMLRSAVAHKADLVLTVDLRAKVLRTTTLYDLLNNVPPNRQETEKRRWIGARVMYIREKKGYDIIDLDFEHTPRTLPIPGKGESHLDYFEKKGIRLEYPDASPMVVVHGRRNQTIFLPPELVSDVELDPSVREMLPQIAGFPTNKRYQALNAIKDFLVPGSQTTRGREGLLPSVGIILKNDQHIVRARVLRVPELVSAGVPIPQERSQMWAPVVQRAKFRIEPARTTELNVVVVHNHRVSQAAANRVYVTIKSVLNAFEAHFRFGDNPPTFISAGDGAQHSGAIEEHFSGGLPPNVFVLDFVKPRGKLESTYHEVKMILARGGYLSQFVNFRNCDHSETRDERKSAIILQGVARQILQKVGVQLWWVKVPRSLPLPAVFIGADVFHSPFRYNPQTRTRERKKSCAAVIVQIIRNHDSCERVEIFSKTHQRPGGQEFNLEEIFESTVQEALRVFKVSPASAIVWRDGIDDSSLATVALAEARGVRNGLSGVVTGQKRKATPPVLAFLVCQKRIANKMFATKQGYEEGSLAAPPGTLIQDMHKTDHETFYINGRAPFYSTPKPVRYIVTLKDEGFTAPIPELTWGQLFSYPNWTGPIKVPNVCMLAHKLAEHAGDFYDSGESISSRIATNLYYL